MDEIKKTETPKGKAKTKATKTRAENAGTLQITPQKCKATASVAASSPSADAEMENAASCPSVQQREIKSATQLVSVKFCRHDKITILMTQAPKKIPNDKAMTKLWYRRQGSETLDSVSGVFDDQPADRLVKQSSGLSSLCIRPEIVPR